MLCVQYTPVIIRAASAPQDLLDARGEEWKTARHTLSPSFSAAKMKAVSLSIRGSYMYTMQCNSFYNV